MKKKNNFTSSDMHATPINSKFRNTLSYHLNAYKNITDQLSSVGLGLYNISKYLCIGLLNKSVYSNDHADAGCYSELIVCLFVCLFVC